MVNLSSSILNKSVLNGRQLYRFLLKECNKLPKEASQHYKFSIKQSYKQHLDETDPERLKEIISRALDDAKWIMEKYKSAPNNKAN